MEEKIFLKYAECFSEKEKILDGECNEVVNEGIFSKEMMERCGFLHMASKHGKTRIVIEYDGNAGVGWKRIVREDG